MDDGAVLLADRWVARARREPGRSRRCWCARPTAGGSCVGLIFGRLLAERGLQVHRSRACAARSAPRGTFSPFDERADGLATLRWIREQPWHAERSG